MVTFLDDLTVGVLLLASILYAAYSLGPKTLRRRLLAALGSALPGSLSRRLQLAAAAKSADSCGGCESCGSAEKTAASESAAAPGGEVRIPLSQIGKRQHRSWF